MEPTGAGGVLAWPVPHDTAWCSAYRAAQAAFDPLWLKSAIGVGGALTLGHARVRCYEWLSACLGRHIGTCHLSMFTTAELESVVDICKGWTALAVASWLKQQPGVKVQTGVLVSTGAYIIPVPYWVRTPPRVRIAWHAYGIQSSKLAVQVACGELKLPHPLREDLLDMLQGDLLLAGGVRGPTTEEMAAKPQDVPMLDYMASRRALVRYEALSKVAKQTAAPLGESK